MCANDYRTRPIGIGDLHLRFADNRSGADASETYYSKVIMPCYPQSQGSYVISLEICYPICKQHGQIALSNINIEEAIIMFHLAIALHCSYVDPNEMVSTTSFRTQSHLSYNVIVPSINSEHHHQGEPSSKIIYVMRHTPGPGTNKQDCGGEGNSRLRYLCRLKNLRYDVILMTAIWQRVRRLLKNSKRHLA